MFANGRGARALAAAGGLALGAAGVGAVVFGIYRAAPQAFVLGNLGYHRARSVGGLFGDWQTGVRHGQAMFGSGAIAELSAAGTQSAMLLVLAVRACNVARGNEKGRVERPIGFVRSRFWPGRRFRDLADLNLQACAWRDDHANGRVHEVTGRVPALVFEHEERAALKPVPSRPFDADDMDSVRNIARTRESEDGIGRESSAVHAASAGNGGRVACQWRSDRGRQRKCSRAARSAGSRS